MIPNNHLHHFLWFSRLDLKAFFILFDKFDRDLLPLHLCPLTEYWLFSFLLDTVKVWFRWRSLSFSPDECHNFLMVIIFAFPLYYLFYSNYFCFSHNFIENMSRCQWFRCFSIYFHQNIIKITEIQKFITFFHYSLLSLIKYLTIFN